MRKQQEKETKETDRKQREITGRRPRGGYGECRVRDWQTQLWVDTRDKCLGDPGSVEHTL